MIFGENSATSAVLDPQRKACGEQFSSSLSQRFAVADQLRSLSSYGNHRSQRFGTKVGLRNQLDSRAVPQPAEPSLFERFEARSTQFEDRYSRFFHPALNRAPNLSMAGSRSSASPYRSSIGGWRDVGDMVLLRWLQEEGTQSEEIAPETQSAWQDKSSYVGARVSKNAWLKHRRTTRPSKSDSPQRSSRPTNAVPKNSPSQERIRGGRLLQRTALRAFAVSNSAATQSIRQAMSELPPNVAPSTLRKIIQLQRTVNESTRSRAVTPALARETSSENQRKSAAHKSYSTSPLVSNVAEHLQAGQPDRALTPTELAKSRSAGRQQNTARNHRSTVGKSARKARGLRPVLSSAPSFQYIDYIEQIDEALDHGIAIAQIPQMSNAPVSKAERRDSSRNSLRPTQRALRQILSPTEEHLLQSEARGRNKAPLREVQSQEEPVDMQAKPTAEENPARKSSISAQRTSAINYAQARHPQNLALQSISQGSILPSPTPAPAVGLSTPTRRPTSHASLEPAGISAVHAQITEITQRKSVLQSLLDSWETAPDERKSSIYTEIVQQRNHIEKLSHRIRRSRLSNPTTVELFSTQSRATEREEIEPVESQRSQVGPSEGARTSENPWLSHRSSGLPSARSQRREEKIQGRKMVFRALQRVMTREAQQSEINPTRMSTSRLMTTSRRMTPSLSQLKAVAAVSGLTLSEVQKEVENVSRSLRNNVNARPFERRKRAIPTAYVDLAPATDEPPEGVDAPPIESSESSTVDKAKNWSSLSNVWSRMLMPQQLPELRSMGTGGRHPMSSPRAWRPSTSYSLNSTDIVSHLGQRIDGSEHSTELFARLEGALLAPRRSALLSPEMNELSPNVDIESEDQEAAAPAARQGSAWHGSATSSDSPLTSLSQQLQRTYKAAPLSWEQAAGQSAVWVQPQRTAMLEDGTIIDSKTVARLGIRVQTGGAEKNRLPLSWTLEGVAAQSDHRSLPKWAKRASERPQIKGSPELLTALVRASTTEEVLDAILARGSEPSSLRTLPTAATQVIEQIRKEADSVTRRERASSTDSEMASSMQMGVLGRLKQQDIASSRLSHSGRPVRRSSQVMREFTGLRPLASAHSESADSETASGTDKLAKLSKRLENLVLLAENQQRDEARMGVRMAEDKESAIDEGQGPQQQIQESPDSQLDIDALRQEVLHAFEMEKSLRKIRSHSDENNSDFWW